MTKRPIRCYIVEDEPYAQAILIKHISAMPNLLLVGTAYNVQQALLHYKQAQPDLLLLDIQMPKLSGFDFLAELPNPLPEIIITSAHFEYAVESFNFSVVDYLLKPIKFERFAEAIGKIETRLATRNKEQAPHNYLIIKSTDRKVEKEQILLSDIQYIMAEENYLRIVTHDKTRIVRKTMSDLLTQLPLSDFIRISRSVIVAKNYIADYRIDTIKTIKGESFSIGATYRESVKSWYYNL
jgi:DNA-binding LytR/AlgR family response regulator